MFSMEMPNLYPPNNVRADALVAPSHFVQGHKVRLPSDIDFALVLMYITCVCVCSSVECGHISHAVLRH